MFRAYFLYVWLILNGIYAFLMIGIVETLGGEGASEGFLLGFSLFIAGLVFFKIIFATLY